MKILTIIVTYNGMQWIDRCLDSLAHSTMHTDVIVIDNCSTDGTREFVLAKYPYVVFKAQDKNTGFGQGNNIGLRYALQHNYDYMLLLNQDAYLSNTALQMLTIHSDKKTLLTPIHLNGTGNDYDHNFLNYSLKRTCTSFLNDISTGNVKPVYPIGEVCAACWFIPRIIIEKIGGFNPLFSQYGEDNNFYQRMLYHGFAIHLVPSATVRHDRKIQGNIEVFSKGQIEREFMLAATNPNLSIIQSYIRIIALIRKFCYSPIKTYKALWHLICNVRNIKNSRCTDRSIGSNWL